MEQEKIDTKYNIEIVDTPPVSQEYKALREKIWEEIVDKGKEAGKEFFNGQVYRLMGFDEESNTIQLGLMQYADRMLKTKISQEEIINRFGKDYIMQHCVVDGILVTSDKKVVMGVKRNSVDLKEGKLAYIGGNMSADEVKVNSFEDMYTMMTKEIEEETSITPVRDRLSFARLVANGDFADFYFIYQLGIPSEDIGSIFKEGEFVRLEAMTPKEIVNTNKTCIKDVNQSKEWIESVI